MTSSTGWATARVQVPYHEGVNMLTASASLFLFGSKWCFSRRMTGIRLLMLVGLAITILLFMGVVQTAQAEYKLYSYSNRDPNNSYNNEPGAYGWDPECQQCECTRDQTAWNNTNTTHRLFCSGFKFLDLTNFTLREGEVITYVGFNVHGRFTGDPGGRFIYRIKWLEDILANIDPNNSFNSNDVCAWRVPEAYRDISNLRNWMANPSDPFGGLEIGVRRMDNATTIKINSVRLNIRTAELEYFEPGYFDPFVGDPMVDTLELEGWGDDPISGFVSWSQSNPAFSILSGGGAFTLAPGQVRNVVIQFHSQDTAYHTGRLSLGVRNLEVLVEGQAEEPALEISDGGVHSFGEVLVGTSVDHSFELQNIEGGLVSGNIVMGDCQSEAYSIISGGGPFSLAFGQVRSVTIRFAPPAEDYYFCSIDIGNEWMDTLDLDGDGVSTLPCHVAPTSHDFQSVYVGTSESRSFTITHDGTNGILEGSVEMDPEWSDPEAFVITNGGGAYTIGPGQNHEFVVAFSPPAVDFYLASVLTGCEEVFVEGVGMPAVTALPEEIDFGTVPINTSVERSFSITNISNTVHTGQAVLPDSCVVFNIVEGAGPYQLQPDETHIITVSFQPTSEDWYDCEVEVGSEWPVWLYGLGSHDTSPVGQEIRPTVVSLAPPRPNPSSGMATIAFDLPLDQDARIDLYDARGRHVKTLTSGQFAAGQHQARWDGRDRSGRRMSAGVYFVRMVTGGQSYFTKVLRVGH